MIRIKHSSGSEFYNDQEWIAYITIWNTVMDTKGSIRFYDGGAIDMIANFQLGEISDEIIMTSYPHNAKKAVLEAAEKHEETIRSAILQVLSKEPNRKLIAMDLKDDKIIVLQPENFNRYTAAAESQDELFFFDNPDPKIGFPKLYLIEKTAANNSPYKDTFRVLSRVSRFAFPTIGKPTHDGMAFTYMLTQSFLSMEFIGFVPGTTGMRFPTKVNCEVPQILHLEKLDEFLISAGIDKIKFVNGILIDSNEEDSDDNIDPYDWEDEDDVPTFLGTEQEKPKESLKDLVWKQIQDKQSFNLQDGFAVGLDKVLSMVPISDKIVQAICDFPGLVQRMCIYQGSFHIVPLGDSIGRLATILDVPEEVIVIETMESFPKNVPLLPKS